MKRKQPPEHPGSPVRTCLGCEGKILQRDLLRFVVSPDGKLIVDNERKLPGRGVYCCPVESCLKKFAGKSKRVARALRVPRIQCPEVPLEEMVDMPGRSGGSGRM